MSLPARIIALSDLLERFYIKDGVLFWKKDIKGHLRKDTPAGYLDTGSGYMRTKINGRNHFVHRIMYQIYENLEELPTHMHIDHIDRNRTNNNKENLQLVEQTENNHNLTKRIKNTSGYTGVIWSDLAHKWRVFIRFDTKKYDLGAYTDIIEAAEAYDIAAISRDAKNHVLNFPEKKEKYLKYIKDTNYVIKNRERIRKGVQSGEKYIQFVKSSTGGINWRTCIVKDKVKNQKHFPFTDEGLQLAIQWRNATYERLYGRPFTE